MIIFIISRTANLRALIRDLRRRVAVCAAQLAQKARSAVAGVGAGKRGSVGSPTRRGYEAWRTDQSTAVPAARDSSLLLCRCRAGAGGDICSTV
eukprot:6184573-Pleurochrysis_carterae.AAC.3